ncbi:Protease HtpX [uncultured archaeon]|nr:Protease HtpX [uncultured archaeon]
MSEEFIADPALRTSWEAEISKNKRKSIILLASLWLIIIALFYVFAQIFSPDYYLAWTIFGVFFSLLYIWITYSLAISISIMAVGGRELNLKNPDEVRLKNLVGALAIGVGIPMPKIVIIETDELNAFACGTSPEKSCVGVTSALLKKMNKVELEGVLSHEMSHITNYDVRFSTLVAISVGLIDILSYTFFRAMLFSGRDNRREGEGNAIFMVIGLVLAIIAPIISRIVQASISRDREYLADASGAKITRYPEGLASALQKIYETNKGMKISESVSHLFTVDPTKSALDNIFATHPPILDRIKKLRAM